MNKKLPILLSVPHAGLRIPREAEPFCILTKDQILKDGDEGANDIYALQEYVETHVTTDIARAIIDLNRAEEDRSADGVVKTHTIWNEPIFRQTMPNDATERLLERYYRPYHEQIQRVDDSIIKLCVDCHTMVATGPPIGPDTGQQRPHVCLGDVNGKTLPAGWMSLLATCFRIPFGESVSINKPFSGGYITRNHGQHRPWVQVELSRSEFMSIEKKRNGVLTALRCFCDQVLDL